MPVGSDGRWCFSDGGGGGGGGASELVYGIHTVSGGGTNEMTGISLSVPPSVFLSFVPVFPFSSLRARQLSSTLSVSTSYCSTTDK